MVRKRFPTARLALAAGALLALAACADRQAKVYQASETGGDYAILDCSQLEVAERSIGQRLSGSASYLSAGEPSALLQAQRDQISATRTSRRCPGDPDLPAATPAELVASADAGQDDVQLAKATYLQVATFLEPANRDRTVAKLASEGFQTFVRPIQLAGRTYYRVVVGPIASTRDLASVDAVTIRMGFNDTFFVKG